VITYRNFIYLHENLVLLLGAIFSDPMKHKCPICGRVVEKPRREAGRVETGPDFYPFCSERCKLLDLGVWLEGRYRIVERESDSDKKDNEG
jgi:endogenous inhibitor of DNA gyrase (YacG/DUF329 family)